MKNKILLWNTIFVFLVTSLGYAFDWPVKEKRVGSSFGQNTAGNFNTGISLLGNDEPVFPIAEGEIIFSYEENRSYSSLPRGLGSCLILYHQGNIQSVYGHLKRGSVAAAVPGYKVSRENQIGVIGNSGASIGGSLFVQIYDAEENLILNPLKEFNPGISDNEKPVIERVLLKRDNTSLQLENNSRIKPGEVNILIQAEDIWRDTKYVRKFTPYKIIMNQNGVEALILTFDSLKEKGNKIVLTGTEKSYTDIYEDDWLINLGKINLVEGIIYLQFLVIDYMKENEKSGNQIASDYKITVNNQ